MKRAAAIIGATPSFVRWTIRHACPFRQLDDSNQPYEAFRQLRSLREVSLAVIEDRIQSGFCVHSTENKEPATARGFPVDEVMAFFGGIESAHTTCGECPANAAKHRANNQTRPQWAGCYGWMPSQHESIDLFSIFNGLPQSLSEKMPYATDLWHRIWQIQRWDESNMSCLQAVFSQLPKATAGLHPELADFRDAVNACVAHNLVLENELVPSGFSDGIKWNIAAHCNICKFESAETTKICVQCGQTNTWVPASSRKVLGLRPYMILQSIIGMKGTQQLLQDLHHKKTGNDSVSENN